MLMLSSPDISFELVRQEDSDQSYSYKIRIYAFMCKEDRKVNVRTDVSSSSIIIEVEMYLYINMYCNIHISNY